MALEAVVLNKPWHDINKRRQVFYEVKFKSLESEAQRRRGAPA